MRELESGLNAVEFRFLLPRSHPNRFECLLFVLVCMFHGAIDPRHEKTCLRGLRPGKTQTGLLSFSS